jgi:hypothetical protein
VAQAHNPIYSGGRDQEDHLWKPAGSNSLRNSISKTLHEKRAGGVAQGVDPNQTLVPQKKKGTKQVPA